MTNDHNRQLNRREFLKATGALAGLLATSGSAKAQEPAGQAEPLGAAPAAVTGPLRLGILHPRSKEYARIGWNMIAGLTLYLEQHDHMLGGRPTRMIKRNIDVGQRLVLEQATKLLDVNRASLVVGMVEPGAAGRVRSLFAERQTFFIANQVGANLSRDGEGSPFVYHNSLGYWQSNWAMGRWAAANAGRRAFLTASHYESGYDALYAFQRGFEEAGGEPVDTHITQVRPDDQGFGPLLAAIEAAHPDFVYALYSGRSAIDFVRAYGRSGLGQRIPLMGGAYLVEKSLLARQGPHCLGIKSAFSWSRVLRNRENRLFVSAFRKRFQRNADGFAVLGYETAQWLDQALSAAGGNMGDVDRFSRALGGARFDGPRGLFTVDPAACSAVAPVYLRQVQAVGGIRDNVVLGELPGTSERDDRWSNLRESVKTGWLNAYLSV